MKFSINIDMVYEGYEDDKCKAIEEVSALGFDGVEICFIKPGEMDGLEEVVKKTGVEVRCMISDFINLTDAAKQQEYIDALKVRLGLCKRLGCRHIMTAFGTDIPGLSHSQQMENVERGMHVILPLLREQNMIGLLEPVNITVDHPGASLWSSKEAFDMAKRFNDDHLRVLFDIYHMQVMEGDVTRSMLENLEWIAHVHCAGNPGRHEIYPGELDYKVILSTLEKEGYQGYFGLEYFSSTTPKEGLEHAKKMFGI